MIFNNNNVVVDDDDSDNDDDNSNNNPIKQELDIVIQCVTLLPSG